MCRALRQHPPILRLLRGAALLLLATSASAELRIEVRGVDEELAANIRHHIGELGERERSRPRQLQQRLERAVTEASQALGYYRSEFHYQLNGDRLQLEVSADNIVYWEEPEISVDAEATAVPAIAKLLSNHPFIAGERIRHPHYDSYKQQLLELLREHGFIDARYLSSRLRIDLDQRRATAVLQLQAGARYRLSAIHFSGSTLRESLLRRLSPLQPGDTLQRSAVTAFQRNLQNSLYFDEVTVKTLTSEPDDAQLQVALRDAPSHQFGIGLGYGTDTGPRTRLRWELPHISDRGHRLSSEAKLSQPIREFGSVYRIPLAQPLYQSLNFSADWTEKNLEDTSSDLGRFGATISDRLGQHWTLNYGTTIEFEGYRQGSQPRQHVLYAVPGVSVSRLELAPGPDPLRGYKTTLALLGSTPALGADSDFLRLTAGHQRLISLGGSHLLLARVELGAISSGDIARIPASKRFFTGGDRSVRGFDYETLATSDDAGELIGGQYLNVASLEYSAKVAERWRLALFTDGGRAYNDSSERWHRSAGLGLRWLSPVGQVRVDVATPVGEDKRSLRLHIYMGPPL